MKLIKNNNRLISFVIPARNEEKTIEPLYSQITQETKKLKLDIEIIFVDDGSTDNTYEVINSLSKKDPRIKIVKLRGGFGKSIALKSGFNISQGDVIFTMDADLQDDPHDIPKFINKLNEGYDLVSGWKKVRYDPISKKIPSRLGNFLTRLLTGIPIHDSNCGFKAYKKEVLKNVNLYGELYKYIPVFAHAQNFKLGEVIITHHPRKFGVSKFGIERNIKGILDLLTVVFLTGFVRRPGHFFGGIGFITFLLGFIIGVYITYLRITTGSIQFRQPLLILGMLLMIIGVQLISTGLLAEMITYYMQEKKR